VAVVPGSFGPVIETIDMLKKGDRVRGNEGYSFDPAEGVVVRLPDGGDFARIEIKHRPEHYGGVTNIWTYHLGNLTLIESAQEDVPEDVAADLVSDAAWAYRAARDAWKSCSESLASARAATGEAAERMDRAEQVIRDACAKLIEAAGLGGVLSTEASRALQVLLMQHYGDGPKAVIERALIEAMQNETF
jgi:hypothetical protein